jgi:protein TonB
VSTHLGALGCAWEQSQKRGVYIDVFEQSILTHDGASKPWTFFASVSAELLAISLALLIPFTKTSHLPSFHWKSVSVGAPAKPLKPAPEVPVSPNTLSGPVFSRRVFVPLPIQTSLGNQAYSSAPFSMEPPGPIGLAGASSPAGGIDINILMPVPTTARPPHVNAPPTQLSGPVRVSLGVQMAKLVKKVIPAYPPLAKTARVSGVVHLLGVIGKDGTIQNLQIVSGHPLLARAAIEAVSQWIYLPTLLNGQPVEVIAPIDVNFTLAQ